MKNTGRENLLEEVGRLDARKNPNSNDMAEKRRVMSEIKDGYKKGGSVKKKKKKQGYKDRKDESIAMRIRKKRTKKQLKASRDDSFGKFGSKAKKSGKINK